MVSNYYGYDYYSGSAIPYPNVRDSQPETYTVITTPTTTPITLDQVKEQLRLDTSDTSEDTYLTTLIEASRDCFESFTGRILIDTQFRTFFNLFRQSFELRKSKLESLDAFEYSVDSTFIAVESSIYYATQESIYSRIIISEEDSIPTDKDDSFQSIRVDFTAGYGTSEDDIPSDIQMGLLQQVTDLYANRGDCSSCDCSNMGGWPAYSAMIYRKYKIKSLYGASFRGGV